MKTSWRFLEDLFPLCLQKVFKISSWRIDQDEYICLSHTFLEDVFKKSWSRPIHSSWSYVFKTSSRRLAKHLQDFFKTFWTRLQDILQKPLQDIFKMTSRRFEDIYNTSSKHLQGVSLYKICKNTSFHRPTFSRIRTESRRTYIYFTFGINIYSFVWQFSLHHYWYCCNQKQSSSGVLQKRCSYKFRKIHKETPSLKTRFSWSCRSTEFNFIKKEIPAHMFSYEFY